MIFLEIFLEIFLKVLAVEYYIEFIVKFDNRVSLFLFLLKGIIEFR